MSGSDVHIDTTGITNITIGGTAPAARNILSGSFAGINGGGPSLAIQGNFIGTDASGTTAIGNSTGIRIDTDPSAVGWPNMVIGGTTTSAHNLISGNTDNIIIGFQNQGPTIEGNFIGTEIDGASTIGVSQNGITVISTVNLTVGGATAGAGNTFGSLGSGGNGSGALNITNSTNAQISSNIFENDGVGVRFHNVNDSAIAENTISDSTSWAIQLSTGTNDTVTGNTISGSSQNTASPSPAWNSNAQAHCTVSNNSITDGGEDGILIQNGSTDSTISANTISGNAAPASPFLTVPACESIHAQFYS